MASAKRKAVVLLSGGVDSSTVLAIAREQGFVPIALSFDYGQRHRVELEAAKRVAKALGALEHRIVAIDMRAIGGSALTDEIEVPKGRLLSQSEFPPPSEGGGQGVGGVQKSVQSTRNSASLTHPPAPSLGGRRSEVVTPKSAVPYPSDIPATYVPARNTIFLSVALAVAEALGARDIFIGVNAIDYSGYPDCRPAFIEAFEKLANVATKAGVEGQNFRVHAPLIQMTKKEIIERGIALGVDYSLTVSCYDPRKIGDHVIACGRCDSCQLRAEGFRAAGVNDPAQTHQH